MAAGRYSLLSVLKLQQAPELPGMPVKTVCWAPLLEFLIGVQYVCVCARARTYMCRGV